MTKTKPRTEVITFHRCNYEFSLICQKCGHHAYNSNGLGIHLRQKHNLSFIEYLKEIKHPYIMPRICKYCNKEFTVSDFLLRIDLKRNKIRCGCSKKCNTRLTCKERYNDEKYRNSEARKQTNLKRYNVENTFQLTNKTFNDFLEKAKKVHNDNYNYDKVIFVSCASPIEILCNKCKQYFWQVPSLHLSGSGCPRCRRSKGELCISNWLDEHNISYIAQYRFKNCKDKNTLPFDFYLPDNNLCIEYQGEQHYKEGFIFFDHLHKHNLEKAEIAFNKLKKHDQIKRDFCKKNKIVLLEIKYNDNIEEELEEYLL